MKPIPWFSLSELRRHCLASFEDYASRYNATITNADNSDSRYIHIDRGGSVLAVAHLDISDGQNWHKVNGKWERLSSTPVAFSHFPGGIQSRALDDRLGAYIILDVLPSLGVVCDVLLTDNEEICQSTAKYFDTDKRYNWVFSFDRAGTDVVLYQYENAETLDVCYDAGIVAGIGSYSDIVDLEYLGVAGFNFGTGYHEQHTDQCYAEHNVVRQCIWQFMRFYAKYGNRQFPHTPRRARDDSLWSVCTDECDQCDNTECRYYGLSSAPCWPSDDRDSPFICKDDCDACSNIQCGDNPDSPNRINPYAGYDTWSYCDWCDRDVAQEEQVVDTGLDLVLCQDCADELDTIRARSVQHGYLVEER